jgi:hypothetical protein
MPNTEPMLETTVVGPIRDRIGPIFDPAFLKLIPKDILREITLIRARALQSTIRAELAAAEELVKAVEKTKM